MANNRSFLELEHEAYEGEGSDGPLMLDPNKLKDSFIDPNNNDEKRMLARVPCFGFLMFYDPAGRILAKGALRDINISGVAAAMTANPFAVGDVVMVEFSVEGNFKMSPMRVTIRRAEPIQPVGNFKIGAEFLNPTGVQKQKITDFIAELKKLSDEQK